MTPCELWLEFEAHQQRQKDRADRQTFLAWRVVQVYVKTMNDKKLPSLKSLLHESSPQTPAAQRTAVSLIAAQFGLTARPRRKENERGR